MANDQGLPVSDDTEVMEVLQTPVLLTAAEKAAIDMQVATAKQYPRVVSKSMEQALEMATRDEETAASCFYSLPRAGKTIEGPSARLAEIMANAWGNLRVDGDVAGEDDTHVTAVGTCFDLEKNVAWRVRVRRRITDKQGKKFSDDMVVVTGNAAISIATRNSVLKTIPKVYWDPIWQAARLASVGKGRTLTKDRQNALAWFGKVGIPEDKIFELLNVRGVEDIGIEELIKLRGLRTAIKDGDTSVEQLLDSGMEAATRERAAELKDKITKSQKKQDAKTKTKQELEEEEKVRKTEQAEQQQQEFDNYEDEDDSEPWT